MKVWNLWPTTIITDKLYQMSDEDNEKLAEIAECYVKEKMVHYDSGFKHAIPNNMMLLYKSDALLKYFKLLEQYFWMYLQNVIKLTPNEITTPRMHMFGNVERRGQWSIPHAHMGNQVVITYYPKIIKSINEPAPLAGQLVFHNPRNPPSGFWARREKLITPLDIETGTIVCFPGHAEHSTFPFFCEESVKYAIVCNIRFAGILEGENSFEKHYKTFDDLKKAQL